MLNHANSETILSNHIRHANIQGTLFSRNTAINNDNISPEHGDNASNYTELTDETFQGMKGNSSTSSATEPRNQLNDQNQTSIQNGDN